MTFKKTMLVLCITSSAFGETNNQSVPTRIKLVSINKNGTTITENIKKYPIKTCAGAGAVVIGLYYVIDSIKAAGNPTLRSMSSTSKDSSINTNIAVGLLLTAVGAYILDSVVQDKKS